VSIKNTPMIAIQSWLFFLGNGQFCRLAVSSTVQQAS
jgi:hypothetical protein